jgi:hypothetical protein
MLNSYHLNALIAIKTTILIQRDINANLAKLGVVCPVVLNP